MTQPYSSDDLLGFLDHAGDRGLIPAATAQALAVATRNVLSVLTADERKNLHRQDIDSVIKRFNNRRAKDLSSASLTEYARRLRRAVDLFINWRADPTTFTVTTRATSIARQRGKDSDTLVVGEDASSRPVEGAPRHGTYDSAMPVRPGVVVTLANVPYDLTKAEAERLATFVRMLAIGA